VGHTDVATRPRNLDGDDRFGTQVGSRYLTKCEQRQGSVSPTGTEAMPTGSATMAP
jgi:hypothetical protein